MNALLYKMQHVKYYKDVQLDLNSIVSLPETCTNVSSCLKFVSVETYNSATTRSNTTTI